MTNDTIAAISTAVSESGIGIIRVSGGDAIRIADEIFEGKSSDLLHSPSHRIHYGYIREQGVTIDEVLVSVFRAPRSYTAEDTVEINCHGGVYAMRRVLETVLAHGARIAEPGEFTKRAFLNGRIDLSRAEAVMDVIRAKNEYALQSSLDQLKGSVQEAVSALRGEVLYEIAHIEAALDDPEHISLDGYPEQLEQRTDDWKQRIRRLIDSAEDGRIIREGVRTVILGKPNAGKSSLLNRMLGEERAIVTEIAGTTRDVLTETATLGGITLCLMDTAGIRRTDDVVEQIGVDRAKQQAKDADLILYVVDSSIPLDENDDRIRELLPGKRCIILLNKSDLEPVIDTKEVQRRYPDLPVLPFSAATGDGLEELKRRIRDLFYEGRIAVHDQIYITNARHRDLLIRAMESLERTRESIRAQMPEDFFSIDLTDVCKRLGEITGEESEDELANEIFAKFCMGK